MNTKKVMLTVTIGLIILIASGCVGDGDSGRQMLPGEIPIGPALWPGPVPGPGPGVGVDPDALLASAWQDFRFGAFSSAISKFHQVLAISGITDTHRAEAHNGLGWSQTKSSGVEAGFADFTQAAETHNEARIGLAAALIQRGQQPGFIQAIQVLEDVGLANTAFRFQARNPIGVTNAEARAMLAFCYFWRNDVGDHDKARAQINVARSEDSSTDSSVAHLHRTLKALGLTGI